MKTGSAFYPDATEYSRNRHYNDNSGRIRASVFEFFLEQRIIESLYRYTVYQVQY